MTAEAGERPTITAAIPNHLSHEKAKPIPNAQIKALSDLVKCRLRAMEEQKEE